VGTPTVVFHRVPTRARQDIPGIRPPIGSFP